MSNSKMTKRALLTSIMALMLCFAMLTGTTFAWFTDQETSGNNKIIAGNLDVQLLMFNGTEYVDIGKSGAPIFGADNSLIAQNNNANTLWEPGKTQIAYLAIRNAGNLALKYNVTVAVEDGGLIGALEYAIVPMANGATATTKLGEDWADIKALDGVDSGDLEAKAYVAAPDGCLDEVRNGYDPANPETDYFALAIHMKEDADNKFMSKSVTIDVIVNATQVAAEADSFDDQYDKDAEILEVNKSTSIVNNNGTLGEEVVLTADMPYGTIKVTVPAGAQLSSADVSSLNLTVKNAESGYNGTLSENQVATGYEIYVAGVADYINPFVNVSGNKIYNYSDIKVELPIGAERVDVKVYKDGMMPSTTWASYDSATGVVTFSADYFTPFSQAKKSNITVVYTELSEAEKQLNEVLENVTSGDSVTINSTAGNAVSVNNIADALNGTSDIVLVGNGADNTTVASNGATITADSLTVKDMTIQSVGTTTINGNNTTIEDVTYQSVGTSYGLTISGSDTTIKDTTVEGNASQGLLLIASGSDTTASVTNVSGLTITEADSLWGSSSGFVFKNMNGTTNITNSTIKVKGSAVSFGPSNSTTRGYANVSNSTFDSTSVYISTVMASTFDTVTFDNTWYDSAISFTAGGTTNTFTNCEFKTDVDFQSANYANKNVTLTFNNCTYNGAAITADNIKDHFVFNNGTFGLQNRDNLTVIVNGVTVTL